MANRDNPAAIGDTAESRRRFGNWLQRKRYQCGRASQKSFAAELGITPTQLSRIETGVSGISKATLDKAIELLGADPGEAYSLAGLTYQGAFPVLNKSRFAAMEEKYDSLPESEQAEMNLILKLVDEELERRRQRQNP